MKNLIKDQHGNIVEFSINRNKWLRQEKDGKKSTLRSQEGEMCCLGHFGRACGVPAKELLGHGAFHTIDTPLPTQITNLFVERNRYSGSNDGTDYAFKLMEVNDNPRLTQEEVEQHIIHYFKQRGIHVIFWN